MDVRTYQMTYTAFTTAHTWTIDGEAKPMKRIFGDTDDDAFDADGWFDEVQTPDTTSAPSAIALSSIVPDDEASGVAVGSTVVLTFNNKVASDQVMLISAAGTPVSATKAYDATPERSSRSHPRPSTYPRARLTLSRLQESLTSTVRPLAATAKNFTHDDLIEEKHNTGRGQKGSSLLRFEKGDLT